MSKSVTAAASPLAPKSFPSRSKPVAGVRLNGRAVGLKPSGAKDLMVAELAKGTTIAGVLTRSRCPSGPVDWCREILPKGPGAGDRRQLGQRQCLHWRGGRQASSPTPLPPRRKLFGCRRDEVYIASTGVIGEPVPPDFIASKLAGMRSGRGLGAQAWRQAAEAIMTTDTFAKGGLADGENRQCRRSPSPASPRGRA